MRLFELQIAMKTLAGSSMRNLRPFSFEIIFGNSETIIVWHFSMIDELSNLIASSKNWLQLSGFKTVSLINSSMFFTSDSDLRTYA